MALDSELRAGDPQISSDQDALDLTGPLAYLQDLRVAVEPGDGELLDESVSPVDLHGLPGRGHGDLARVELGHGGLRLVRTALVPQPRRAIRGQACGVDGHSHVGDLELDGLKVRDRPPEGHPL